MVKLLIVIAIVGVVMTFLWRQQSPDEPPEVIYQDQTDKARALEDQLQKNLEIRTREIDKKMEN